MGRTLTERTRQRAREVFLAELAQRGIVLDACVLAGISRTTAYAWRESDPAFARDWDEALEAAADTLEREAWRRAVEGTEKPLIGRIGKDEDGIITTVTEYSDTLMVKLLGARRPSKFRERTQEEPIPPIEWDRVTEADQIAFLDGKLSLADIVRRYQPSR